MGSPEQVIPAMKGAGAGTILFIGATASLRRGPRSAAFAPAKAAQRSLWPAGIHVALIVIDDVVDPPRTRKAMPDKADDFFQKPEEVAATVVWLERQPRSAWTFEAAVRPFGENW